MDFNFLKHELQNILRGKGEVSYGESIQAAASYLRKSTQTSTVAQRNEPNKAEETKSLIAYINANHLWNCDINFNLFLSEGAEQRVYIKDKSKVLKLNDSIYYESWLDYLQNLLLNNYFFPDTAYNLLGFYKASNDVLYALVEQNYIEATQPTDLSRVKDFLVSNGFVNNRNHDYYHADLGIILEDLHDENVLTANDILYFIDTVFYIKPQILWN
ncbi:MAG: hypothetical protein EAZ08_07015 [Cytophagales bacterium]|nr:MAG: hypothetical protein EAZ08_07015 [Cytophagales bacterium]